jgi:Uma2 family endonuclease
MTAQPKAKMTADEFLAWAEGRPERYELVDSAVFAMSPERVLHARVKFTAQSALADGVRRADLPCKALPDGMAARIDAMTAYEPDALVSCGPRLAGDAIEVSNLIILVKVLSPSTGPHDTGTKLAGYFQIESVQHYLILDPVRKLFIHHRRGAEAIEARISREGSLSLDPLGLKVAVEAQFAED